MREFGDDPAVRRVCHVVVPVAPATAVAAARLGDDEHEWLEQWVARAPEPSGGDGAAPSSTEVPLASADDGSEIATALLDRLGPLGARRALKLVRGGEGDTRAALAGALVRHSGLGELQELIGSRFLSRADALRSRTVLAGLDALIRTTPPESDARGLSYQLERVRAGAHELREIELLDLLRCGGLNLPDEQRSMAERLLGADGDGVRDRLALAADATAEQVREAAALQVARWRQIADHPVASTRVRDAAHDLVRTCERLAAGTEVAAPR